jgi:hypothetical protein
MLNLPYIDIGTSTQLFKETIAEISAGDLVRRFGCDIYKISTVLLKDIPPKARTHTISNQPSLLFYT